MASVKPFYDYIMCGLFIQEVYKIIIGKICSYTFDSVHILNKLNLEI